MTELIVVFCSFSKVPKNDEGFTDALSFVFYDDVMSHIT